MDNSSTNIGLDYTTPPTNVNPHFDYCGFLSDKQYFMGYLEGVVQKSPPTPTFKSNSYPLLIFPHKDTASPVPPDPLPVCRNHSTPDCSRSYWKIHGTTLHKCCAFGFPLHIYVVCYQYMCKKLKQYQNFQEN